MRYFVGPSTPLFFLGTALAGAGWGSSLLGSFGALAALAGPTERAKLFASVYVVSYIAFGVPAVAAGLVIPSLGLRATTIWYGAAVITLALLAVLIAAARRHTANTTAATPSKPPAARSPFLYGGDHSRAMTIITVSRVERARFSHGPLGSAVRNADHRIPGGSQLHATSVTG